MAHSTLTKDKLLAIVDPIPGWMGSDELWWNHQKAAEVVPPGGTWVEVGLWKGRSWLATALGLPDGATMAGIDTFAGDPELLDGPHAEAKDPGYLFREFMKAVDILRHVRPGVKVDIRQQDSVAGADGFDARSVDGVFIDGAHNEAQVTKDMAVWHTRVRHGGVFCGHDRNYPSVQGAWRTIFGSERMYHAPGISEIWHRQPWFVRHQSWPELEKRVRTGDCFSYARTGDGEWRSILGYGGKGSDQQPYSHELTEDLNKVVLSGRVYPGEGKLHVGFHCADEAVEMTPLIGNCLVGWGLHGKTWWGIETFGQALLDAQERREVNPVVRLLRERAGFASSVLVAPGRYGQLMKMGIPFDHHVIVPEVDTYQRVDKVVRDASHLLLDMPKPALVLIVAGLTADVLVHRLYARHGSDCWFWDFGSSFEPYLGTPNRSWHARVGKPIL